MKIRKNDGAYLQNFKIDIHASRAVHYQELTLFFDKPQFLDLLPYLRQTYKVTSLFSLADFEGEFDCHLHSTHLGESVKIDLPKYSKTKELKDISLYTY